MLVKDMFEKNGHNPSCGFAGDIVSYLYDEIDTGEKVKFETHLAGCTTCGAELAAFSGVRTSIVDWREADFGWLPTPDIVIPYEKTEERPVIAAETRSTILTDLKRLFSFTPWPPAFAAFGALAIFLGLTIFAVSYLNRSEQQVASNKGDKPIVSPTAEASPQTGTKDVAVNQPESKTPDTVAVPAKDPAPKVINASVNVPGPQKNGTASPKKSNEAGRPNNKNESPQKKTAPNLNNYTEDEDTTLRLADLFEEIDTME